MQKIILCSVLFVISCVFCDDIFHVKSKITFVPDMDSKYFGFSLVLMNSSLIVGAPKARSRVNKTISPGIVLRCQLTELDKSNVTCRPYFSLHDYGSRWRLLYSDYIRDDMWYGAAMAAMPNQKFIVCAPRWTDSYRSDVILMFGACFMQTMRRNITINLKDKSRLSKMVDGSRKEYGAARTNLFFYAYGSMGWSVTVNNKNLGIGAPGVLQWAGSVVSYNYDTDPYSVYNKKRPTPDPYYTMDVVPDDYLGYSVESGTFQVDGTILYVAGAPRARNGYGQVLIFDPPVRETEPLRIRTQVRGSQLGAYFGSSVCCTDIDGDGRTDVLVGAPNFANKNGELPFDQGVVFVYMTREQGSGFVLEDAGYVMGSGESGARFGMSIASLGDVDGDGINDIAIGAPWEENGRGTVYIFTGNKKGLNTPFVQRITAQGAGGFGISLSKGLDVDGNHCNDLAIGAHNSDTAYLYRCVPTIEVHASIKVPDVMNLPANATNFTALFCVKVPKSDLWPHVKIDLRGKITVDPEYNRAMISGDPGYETVAKPGEENCDDQIVNVKPTADLSKPITMSLELKPATIDDTEKFPHKLARVSENSTLATTLVIQLLADCGEDLVCTPWLEMTMESFNTFYTPGTDEPLGVNITVLNKAEPAYGAQVYIDLPLTPKRIPAECSLESLNMTCNVTAPLRRMDSINWEIELEYPNSSVVADVISVTAELKHPLYIGNISADVIKEVSVLVEPKANFSVNGKALPNITVTREKFDEGGNVTYIHYFEITNNGPSDWSNLDATIDIPEKIVISKPTKGCTLVENAMNCSWSMQAKTTLMIPIHLLLDLNIYGDEFDSLMSYNASTTARLVTEQQQLNTTVTTVLIIEPSVAIWPYIVGSVVGFVILAVSVIGLERCGFFSRATRDELKELKLNQNETVSLDQPSTSIAQPRSEEETMSTSQLLCNADDSSNHSGVF